MNDVLFVGGLGVAAFLVYWFGVVWGRVDNG
jgi:hypothetical protein